MYQATIKNAEGQTVAVGQLATLGLARKVAKAFSTEGQTVQVTKSVDLAKKPRAKK